jgi:hypothetical protein
MLLKTPVPVHPPVIRRRQSVLQKNRTTVRACARTSLFGVFLIVRVEIVRRKIVRIARLGLDGLIDRHVGIAVGRVVVVATSR